MRGEDIERERHREGRTLRGKILRRGELRRKTLREELNEKGGY